MPTRFPAPGQHRRRSTAVDVVTTNQQSSDARDYPGVGAPMNWGQLCVQRTHLVRRLFHHDHSPTHRRRIALRCLTFHCGSGGSGGNGQLIARFADRCRLPPADTVRPIPHRRLPTPTYPDRRIRGHHLRTCRPLSHQRRTPSRAASCPVAAAAQDAMTALPPVTRLRPTPVRARLRGACGKSFGRTDPRLFEAGALVTHADK